jgi:hypothetical protein
LDHRDKFIATSHNKTLTSCYCGCWPLVSSQFQLHQNHVEPAILLDPDAFQHSGVLKSTAFMNSNRSDVCAVADKSDYFFVATVTASFDQTFQKTPPDALS